MMNRLDSRPWMTAPATRAVIAALQAAGGPGAARFVGGCVRDALLGRDAPDIDIDVATPLTPDAVVRALEAAGLRAVPTGIEHGTVTAVAHGRPVEITTLRRDVETDGRHAVVAFTEDWGQDAARRDFRLNALYADPDGTLHDPTGCGVDDALTGRVVFVGDPAARIREDYLRVLRFFRFFAHYGRGPADPAAAAACAALRDGLAGLSAERVSKELLKLLAAPDPRPAVRLMETTGVLAVLLPEAGGLERFEGLTALGAAGADPVLRLAALLDGPVGETVARRLRLPNRVRDRLAAATVVDPDLSPDASGLGDAPLRGLARAAGDRRTLDAAPVPADRRRCGRGRGCARPGDGPAAQDPAGRVAGAGLPAGPGGAVGAAGGPGGEAGLELAVIEAVAAQAAVQAKLAFRTGRHRVGAVATMGAGRGAWAIARLISPSIARAGGGAVSGVGPIGGPRRSAGGARRRGGVAVGRSTGRVRGGTARGHRPRIGARGPHGLGQTRRDAEKTGGGQPQGQPADGGARWRGHDAPSPL